MLRATAAKLYNMHPAFSENLKPSFLAFMNQALTNFVNRRMQINQLYLTSTIMLSSDQRDKKCWAEKTAACKKRLVPAAGKQLKETGDQSCNKQSRNIA